MTTFNQSELTEEEFEELKKLHIKYQTTGLTDAQFDRWMELWKKRSRTS